MKKVAYNSRLSIPGRITQALFSAFSALVVNKGNRSIWEKLSISMILMGIYIIVLGIILLMASQPQALVWGEKMAISVLGTLELILVLRKSLGFIVVPWTNIVNWVNTTLQIFLYGALNREKYAIKSFTFQWRR
jgi:hypothetical protein